MYIYIYPLVLAICTGGLYYAILHPLTDCYKYYINPDRLAPPVLLSVQCSIAMYRSQITQTRPTRSAFRAISPASCIWSNVPIYVST